ncbi:MAG: DUF2892 domain-containing protein [Paracoccaceae bacterium]
MFKTNVGGIDRIIRIALGVVLIALYFMNPGMSLGWLALVVGIIALATGALKSCPLYSILGLSTCPMKKS